MHDIQDLQYKLQVAALPERPPNKPLPEALQRPRKGA